MNFLQRSSCLSFLAQPGTVASTFPHRLGLVPAPSSCVLYSTIMADYEKLEAASELKSDPNQRAVVSRLQELQDRLNGYQAPGDSTGRNLLSKLFSRSRRNPVKSVMKGLYMYGAVGSGKTMLMDMFYESVKVTKKKRVHFNGFMLDIHKRIHRFKDHVPRKQRGKVQMYDPIGPVARDVAGESHLLCFDEFQVTDIADAMVLKGLFTALFECGVVVVATSNRQPDDLYRNGLQRGNFLPFISVLKENCDVTHLQTLDYRETVLASLKRVYMVPNDRESNQKLENTFEDIAKKEGTAIGAKQLEFLGRKLLVPQAAGSLAMFTFEELCNGPLSAADYIHLCQNFETLFVRDIPKMTIKRRSEARRFITMVDNLYNHRVKLICTAQTPPSQLFLAETASALDDHDSRILSDDLNIEQGSANHSASIFTGEEEIFAFERTVSRLVEMQGDDYLNSEWVIPGQDR